MTLSMEVTATAGPARAGVIRTARGEIRTPCFMPVGTTGRGAHALVGRPGRPRRADRPRQHLPPDAQARRRRSSASWAACTASPTGRATSSPTRAGTRSSPSSRAATWPSTTTASPSGPPTTAAPTGSRRRPPSRSRPLLGADIQMVLDVCAPLPSSHEVLRSAVDRTAAWAERAPRARSSPRTARSSASSGSCRAAPTSRCAARAPSARSPSGSTATRSAACRWASRATPCSRRSAATLPHLPDDQPRYLMGLGDPLGIVEAVALGIDLFDCVLPTRFGRHGSILSSAGRYNLKRAENTSGRRRPSTRPAAARCAPAGRGPTCATCWSSTSPPLPGSSPSTTCGGRCAWWRRCGRPWRPDRSTGCVRASRRPMANLLRRPSRPPRAGSGPNPCVARSSPPSSSSSSSPRSPSAPCFASDTSPQLGLDLQGGVSVVLQPTKESSDEALSQTIEIIRSRVDALGVAEPEIARQGGSIVVQLPGVKNQQRAIELVGDTAELRFRPVLFSFPGDLDDLSTSTTAADGSTTTTAADGSTTTTAAGGTTTTTAGDTTTTAPVEGQSAGGRADAVPGSEQHHHHDRAPAAPPRPPRPGRTTTTTAPDRRTRPSSSSPRARRTSPRPRCSSRSSATTARPRTRTSSARRRPPAPS